MSDIVLHLAVFPYKKMIGYRKISENEMLARLIVGHDLLPPLIITQLQRNERRGDRWIDARIEVGKADTAERFWFVLEAKSLSTPLVARNAMAQAKAFSKQGDLPMIMLPYLSPERLLDLEREGVSGVDLCGNGVIIVPDRYYVLRTGQPNKYPESRPLNNPYRGRSAMVARIFLIRPRWKSLNELQAATMEAGAPISLSQTSKVVQAMQDDLILTKRGGEIILIDSLLLLDKLGREWRKSAILGSQALRLPPGINVAGALSSNPQLKWAVTGESSVARYTMFSQSRPRQIAVNKLSLAQALVNGTPEQVTSFSDLELIETEEPGYFFGNELDDRGMRWASRLQTWLELQSGDGRQQDAARDLRNQILKEAKA